MKREYHLVTAENHGTCCEHCDELPPQMVRLDGLRGYVCKDCDSVLDEMLNEPASTVY